MLTEPPDSPDCSSDPVPPQAAAGQVLVKLVRSFPTMPDDLSAEKIAAAAWQLGQPSNRAQAMAAFCSAFLLAHNNHNYDLATNGEQWVLRRLAPFAPSVIFDVGANAGGTTGTRRSCS